jgi:hypothetical protein
MITIIAERVILDSRMRVSLRFPYDEEIVKAITALPDAVWDGRMNCWHVAAEKNINKIIINALIDIARIEFR